MSSLPTVESRALNNFVQTCKTPATRILYTKVLEYFMKYLQLEPGNYDFDKLLEKNPKLIQMDICDFIIYLRSKTSLSSGSISTYVSAIRKFYTMNDVQLNWTKIHSFEGEREKKVEDRPYTHSEIKTLIENTDPRNRAIILLMASSGPRVGALPYVRIRDLEPNDNYGIYKITYYPNSKKFRYFSWCTPECRQALDSYLEWRRRWGERLTEDTPVFRTDFNARNAERSAKSNTISTFRMRSIVAEIARESGLRHVPTEKTPHSKIAKRTDIMANHGLRKFFETNAHRAGMDLIYIRRLLGQKSGLEDSYLKLEEQELLEGDSRHVGYIGIIDQLTISDENRVRRENQILKIRADKADAALERIMQIEQQLGLGK
jgi:integrase